MNEIEKAIAHFNSIRCDDPECVSCHFNDIALAALREQQKRQDGRNLANDVNALCDEVEKLRVERDAQYKTAQTAIRAMTEEYNKVVKERDELKSKYDEEVSRRYQAECNYDHTVKDRDVLHRALEMAEKLDNFVGWNMAERKLAKRAASVLRKVAEGEYGPVMHGVWALARESERCYLVKCTNCGHSVAIAANVPVDEWRAIHRYCVDCGALMDARENSPENDEKAHSDAHSEAAQRKDSSHETD